MNITPIRKNLIPVLSSNNSNENYIITSSSEYYPAYKAFNNTNIDSSDCFMVDKSDKTRSLIISMNDFHYINGLICTSRNHTDPKEIYSSDWDVYISDNGVTWNKYLSFATSTLPNTNKEILFPKAKCRFIKLVSLCQDSYAAIGKLEFYEVEEFYAIKQNDKYYSFHPNQYDIQTKMFKEVTAKELIENSEKEGYLSEKYYLTSQMTFGEESFRPIDKFNNNFKLISVNTKPVSINGIKSKREMIIGNSDFSCKFISNIDKFIPEYKLSDGCSIKMAVSVDEGNTWKYTTDNGVTWVNIVDNVKLTSPKDKDWKAVEDLIFDHGIDITQLEKINFNTLNTKLETIRFAYVINITKLSDEAINTILKWQFDVLGTMQQLSKNEVDINFSKEQIKITPKKDINLLKVNVGTGGSIVINESKPTDVEEVTNDEIVNTVNEVWK